MKRYLVAICLDFGDTLVDEGTEVKDESSTSLRAELIPGAGELVHELKRRGYKLALVADGRPDTYYNVLTQHGLYGLFDAYTISEHLGMEKPDARMFHDALEKLGVAREDYGRALMMGNNLGRDIKGANAVGMVSVWLDWAPRRSKIPADETEAPNYTIKMPLELLNVIDVLEAGSNIYGQ